MDSGEERPAASTALNWRSHPLVWLAGTVMAVLIVVLVVLNGADGGQLPGQEFPSQGNQHIPEVGADHPEYNSDPPTSGWHVGRLARWGSYDYQLPDELLIHNMEDGGVILWYPLASPEQNRAHIKRLQEAARGYDRVVILPREDLSGEYALTAWTRLDRFPVDDYDAERVRRFLEAYEGVDHH
jgi:hypothetical protein